MSDSPPKFKQPHTRIRRRHRQHTVCVQCRRRKVKCDKKHPCSQCIKAHRNCSYLSIKAPKELRHHDESSNLETKSNTGPVYTQLELRIADLERQINSLIGNTSGYVSNTKDVVPVMGWKLPDLKESVIVVGEPYFFYLGPSCRALVIYSMPMFRNYVSRLKLAMAQESSKWLRKHNTSSISLSILDSEQDEMTISDAAFQLISVNRHSFDEYISYFEKNLNNLVFFGFVPMDMVHRRFIELFDDGLHGKHTAPQSTGGKSFIYCDISLIVAVVYLSTVFTQHDDMELGSFKYPLMLTTTELSSLAFKLLNISKFRNRSSYIGLVALIVLSKGLFVFENAEGTRQELESYPAFQMCLSSSYQLGLHSDFNAARKFVFNNNESKSSLLSDTHLRNIWNYLQEEDAFYSVMMGYPLLINYDFCNEFHMMADTPFESKRRDSLNLLRQISQIINSRPQISLREVCNQIAGVLRYCSSLPSVIASVNEFINLDEIAFLCKQKLVYLQVLQCLCWMGITGISIILRYKSSNLDGHEKSYIINLSGRFYRQLLISAAISIYTIKAIISGKSIFGTNTDGKYFVFLKDIFTTLLGHSYTLWFTFILPEATGNTDLINEVQRGMFLREFSSKKNPWKGTVDLTLLENVLFGGAVDQDDKVSRQLFFRLLSPSDLLNLTSQLYDVLSKNEVIKGSLDSFLVIKSVMVWSIIITTVEEHKSQLLSKEITLSNIMEKAREKLLIEFGAEQDNTADLNMEEYDKIEKMLDAVFGGYSH